MAEQTGKEQRSDQFPDPGNQSEHKSHTGAQDKRGQDPDPACREICHKRLQKMQGDPPVDILEQENAECDRSKR